jgi:protein TonB
MKTQDEMKNVPSFDELVFENRNLEYGAYQIRKKYNVALVWSILVSVFFVSATVVTPFFIYDRGPLTLEPIGNGTVFAFDSTLIKISLPIEEVQKPQPTIPKIQPYLAPQVVDTVPLNNDNPFATIDVYNSLPRNDSVVDVVDRPHGEIDPDVDPNKPLETFQITEQPYFGTGGDNEFRNWVSNSIIYPQLPLENGIQGKVFLQFVVEKDGSLSSIKVIRAADPELGQEAIRVLKSSPKWNPGKQQGNPVRVNFNFMITFSIK